MDESIERIEAPPDITQIIQTAIRDMHLATSEEVQAARDDLEAIAGRVQTLEQEFAELPKVYASTDSLDKVKTSQAGYESGLRQLTEQVAGITIITADNQKKFGTIEIRLNDLTGVMNTMTGNLQTFMDTQRLAVTNQQATIAEAKNKAETLAQEVATVKKDFNPLHDFIVGSETQKPLITIIDGIQSTQTTQGQTLQTVADYVKAQQQKEADRLSFWRSVRLQMWTWRGVLSMLLALLVFLIIVNSINFDQLFERIRQLADVIAGLLRSVKVG